MTVVKEQYQVFDLSDVVHVAFQCGHCKGEIVNSSG